MADSANLTWSIDTATAQLGSYHAAETSTRRADTGNRIRSADSLLTEQKRRRAIEGARDARRNYAVAAWMIRRHLDYVTSFSFQPGTGDAAFDRQWADLMTRWSRRQQCDVTRRRPLQTLLRMLEAARTIAGDVLVVRLADGRLQPIEGDRIRDPQLKNNAKPPEPMTHGVHHTPELEHLAYAVHKRDATGGYEFSRWVGAHNATLLGYFEDFDQIRGVSPLVTALNPLRDVYEATEYALAKMKIAQLFGLAIYREMTDESDPLPAPETDAEEADEEASEDAGRYSVDFGKGPLKLELEPGDKAEFLEAQSPSAPFQEFSKTEIAIALKALDIPFSFYDEAATNFYGSRAAAMQYERSCQHKRDDLHDLLRILTIWKTIEWIRRGHLILPAGASLADVLELFEWLHQGTPWWKPLEETNADISAIKAGFRTHDDVTRERYGKPFRQVIDTLAAEHAYAKTKGVALDTLVQPQPAAQALKVLKP